MFRTTHDHDLSLPGGWLLGRPGPVLRGYKSGAAPEECVMPACPRPGDGVRELTVRVARAMLSRTRRVRADRDITCLIDDKRDISLPADAIRVGLGANCTCPGFDGEIR